MKNEYLLLVIDAQKGIDDVSHWGGNRNNRFAEKNIEQLPSLFRSQKLPIIHVRHNSDNPRSPLFPGQPEHEFKPEAQPINSEPIVNKSTPNAFIGTELEEMIVSSGANKIVIVGFVTNNSIESTARMSGNLGFKTVVISDATATFDKEGISGEVFPSELVHSLSLANLDQEYAVVMSTIELISQINQ